MHSVSMQTKAHLVSFDAEVTEALLSLPQAERWSWTRWPDLEALAEDLVAEPRAGRIRVVVTVGELSDLDTLRLRELQSSPVRLDVLVAARSLEPNEVRRLLADGVSNVEQLPLPPLPLEVLLSERRHLALLFPGELLGHRREILEFEVPARREAVPPLVRTLAERCEGLGHPRDFVRSQLPLVVDEAVTNAMEHGHHWDPDRPVRVLATLTFERIEIVVQDDGPGFVREDVADPLRGENRRRAGGRGLFLMESLMDAVEYRDGGRTVVLRKRMRQGDPAVVEPTV